MNERTIKNMPEKMRPYERCLAEGPGSLTDSELLAIIIRTGVSGMNSVELSNKILAEGYPEGILGLLHYSLQDLTKYPGIGEVKALQLMCIGELSARISKASFRENQEIITNPVSLYNYFSPLLRHSEQEEFHLLSLDSKNNIIHDSLIFKGTVNTSLASPREIFIEACKYHAVSVIAAHNHPSGDSSPSEADICLTNKLFRCGELMEIRLLDHIIIGDNNYFSFKDWGLLTYEKQ